MAAPLNSSKPTKRSIDYASQKRLTQFFPRSPVAVVPLKTEETNIPTSPVPRKRVKKRIIPNSPIRNIHSPPVKEINLIEITDSESSDDKAENDVFAFPLSPPKKAKAVKRPLPQMSSIPRSFKTEDNSLKKGSLGLCNIQVSSGNSIRSALEEKKDVNIGKAKRQHGTSILNRPDISDMEDREENRLLNEKKFKCENFMSSKEDSNKSSGPVPYPETKRPKTADKSSKNYVSSQIQQKNPTKSREEKDDTISTKSSSGKRKKEELSSMKLVDVNEVKDDGSNPLLQQTEVTAVVLKADKREATNKTVRIIRRSSIRRPEEKDRFSITSKIEVGLEEIGAGASVAFRQTYKDIETLLDMNLGVRISHNFQWCMKNSRRPLANRFHVNFKFFMNRGDHIGAMASLRSVNCYEYPHNADLHSIIHEILMNGKDQLALHRGQELIYKIVGLHPSCDAIMRKYYWSVISCHFDDSDPCSRWENLRYLLDQVLEVDGEDAQKMYANPDLPPSKLECQRAVLGFIVNLLNEDLRCWIRLTERPSVQLRDRVDIPLIARLLWSQSTIPHINGYCRELIGFHVAALKSGDSCKISYTEPLVKMMALVTQLSDLQLPLKVRKPSVRMMELAREILHHSDCLIDKQISFYNSFGSPELSLLLPLTVLNRQKPDISIPEGELLSLTWLLNSYLEPDSGTREQVVTRFWSLPPVQRSAFLTALATYFKLYCAFKTWFHIRDKYRESSRHDTRNGHRSNQPKSVAMFSRTFSPNHLIDDLRQTKYLLGVDREISRSVYSLLSWS